MNKDRIITTDQIDFIQQEYLKIKGKLDTVKQITFSGLSEATIIESIQKILKTDNIKTLNEVMKEARQHSKYAENFDTKENAYLDGVKYGYTSKF